MSGPRRPSGIVQAVCVTIVAIIALDGAPAADSPEAREAAGVLCGYVAARNGHDFSRARALVAGDVRWLDTEGRNHPKNDARLKTMLSWEEVMGAAWGCRVLGLADGWLEAEISERNRMYDALGVGTLLQRDRVRVAGKRIREGRTLAEWSTGREEDEALREFKDWLKKLPPDRRAGVLRDGNLIYDAESARRTLPLLDLWEREHTPARRLLAVALEALGERSGSRRSTTGSSKAGAARTFPRSCRDSPRTSRPGGRTKRSWPSSGRRALWRGSARHRETTGA
jgi:hypothetical protein